jgi:hypothetical protein
LLLTLVPPIGAPGFTQDSNKWKEPRAPTIKDWRAHDQLKQKLKPLLNYTPYEYQYRTISWMKQLEDEVDTRKGFDIGNDDMKWHGVKTAVGFDHLDESLQIFTGTHCLPSVLYYHDIT